MPSTEGVRVTIFNQTYTLVASEEPGRIELLAQKVDDLMSKIAAHGANVDATRAAVLACLHMADELDTLEQQLTDLKQKVEHKAREFSILLDEAIAPADAQLTMGYVDFDKGFQWVLQPPKSALPPPSETKPQEPGAPSLLHKSGS